MAFRKQLLIDQPNMYKLTTDDVGTLYMEVICGGFAMENIVVPLNSEEVSRYNESGKDFLDEMAVRIRHRRDQYIDRIVR